MSEWKNWQTACNDLEDSLIAVQHQAVASFWPAMALAIAALDAKLIDRKRLLTIISTLRDYVLSEADLSVSGEEAALPLQKFEEIVEQAVPVNGDHLQIFEIAIAIAAREAGYRPPKGPRPAPE